MHVVWPCKVYPRLEDRGEQLSRQYAVAWIGTGQTPLLTIIRRIIKRGECRSFVFVGQIWCCVFFSLATFEGRNLTARSQSNQDEGA